MAIEGEMPGNAPPKIPHNTPANADKMTHPEDRFESANKKLSMFIYQSTVTTYQLASEFLKQSQTTTTTRGR